MLMHQSYANMLPFFLHRDCYEGYLNSGINDGPACVRLTCPQHLWYACMLECLYMLGCMHDVSLSNVTMSCSVHAYVYSMSVTD